MDAAKALGEEAVKGLSSQEQSHIKPKLEELDEASKKSARETLGSLASPQFTDIEIQSGVARITKDAAVVNGGVLGGIDHGRGATEMFQRANLLLKDAPTTAEQSTIDALKLDIRQKFVEQDGNLKDFDPAEQDEYVDGLVNDERYKLLLRQSTEKAFNEDLTPRIDYLKKQYLATGVDPATAEGKARWDATKEWQKRVDDMAVSTAREFTQTIREGNRNTLQAENKNIRDATVNGLVDELSQRFSDGKTGKKNIDTAYLYLRTGNMSQMLTDLGVSPADAAKILANKDLANQMKSEFIKNTMVERAVAGEVPKVAEFMQLRRIHGNEVVTRAFVESNTTKAMVEQGLRNGQIKKEFSQAAKDWLKGNWKTIPLGFIIAVMLSLAMGPAIFKAGAQQRHGMAA